MAGTSERAPVGGVSEYAFDHAPDWLTQQFLECLIRKQTATSKLEIYRERRRFIELKKQIDEYEPVDIVLSDGKTMRLGCTRPNCKSRLCLRRPTTRAGCPTGVCPHIRCRSHLWRVDSGDRAGRPGLSQVPRDRRGLTLPVIGNVGQKRAGTTLEARWLETPVPPSCALDCADKGPMSNEQIGDALNRHRTLIGKDVPDAMESAKARAREMGMSEEDLVRGLRELAQSLVEKLGLDKA